MNDVQAIFYSDLKGNSDMNILEKYDSGRQQQQMAILQKLNLKWQTACGFNKGERRKAHRERLKSTE